MTTKKAKPPAGGQGVSGEVDSGGGRRGKSSAKLDALVAGIECIQAAGQVSPEEFEALQKRHDEALALAAAEPLPLDTPLPNPLDVYHPLHTETRLDKRSGDKEFLRAKGTVENLARLVKAYGVQVRYNELARDIEISVSGRSRVGELVRNTNLAMIEDICRINAYPHTQVAGNLFSLAELNSYNPALDWIKSKPWDGTPRMGDLFDCLELADPARYQLSWALFQKWLLGAVAILSGKATKFEHVLVLVDPTGGIGKTRFFNSLCPAEYQIDGVALNVNDKDSVLNVISKWLVELGEIGATFNRSDIESIKAFMSRSFDEVRPPYARAANHYARRTAFFGSVNNVKFLVDDTNNRRFWPIEVKSVNYSHSIDPQQLWAEVLKEVSLGKVEWWLSPRENDAVGELNESFRSMDRVEEMIRAAYVAGDTPSRYLSASEALDEIGFMYPKQADTRKASSMLRKLFAHKVSRGYTVYHLPYARKGRQPLSAVPDRYETGPF